MAQVEEMKKEFAFITFDGDSDNHFGRYGIYVISKYIAANELEACNMLIHDVKTITDIIEYNCNGYKSYKYDVGKDVKNPNVFGHTFNIKDSVCDIVADFVVNAKPENILDGINATWQKNKIRSYALVDTENVLFKICESTGFVN